jgi:hypothetical protein
MPIRSSSRVRIDRAAAAHFPLVAAVSGRMPPWPRSAVGRVRAGFRRDPAGLGCLRGTTENWSATSFDTNERSRAFTYDHARRAENPGEREFVVRLRADAYAYFVEVDVADERVRYSDNFIEFEPGEERRITIQHPDAAIGLEDVTLRWR